MYSWYCVPLSILIIFIKYNYIQITSEHLASILEYSGYLSVQCLLTTGSTYVAPEVQNKFLHIYYYQNPSEILTNTKTNSFVLRINVIINLEISIKPEDNQFHSNFRSRRGDLPPSSSPLLAHVKGFNLHVYESHHYSYILVSLLFHSRSLSDNKLTMTID